MTQKTQEAENADANTVGLSAKQIFDLLRGEYENTAEFATDLFQEDLLQEKLRIIANGLTPLHDEYNRDFELESQNDMMSLQARRADHDYYRCVTETLELMVDPRWLDHLSLCHQSLGDICLDPDSASMRTDESLLTLLFNFCVHLASARCWSQSFFSLIMPYMLAGIHHPVEEKKADVASRMSKVSTAILQLEDYVEKHPDRKKKRSQQLSFYVILAQPTGS